MATIADYLVITKARFKMKREPAVLPAHTEITFNFQLPAGTTMLQGQPVLQYIVDNLQTPGIPNQFGLLVKVNGTEVHRKLFLEGTQDHFTQAVIPGEAFVLTGLNAMTFYGYSPIADTTSAIDFHTALLWFQRDSAAMG